MDALLSVSTSFFVLNFSYSTLTQTGLTAQTVTDVSVSLSLTALTTTWRCDLCFGNRWEEINRTREMLMSNHGVDVMVLHSMISAAEDGIGVFTGKSFEIDKSVYDKSQIVG